MVIIGNSYCSKIIFCLKTINNIKRILRVRKEIQPKSYYEELAEQGLLYDYVLNYYKDRIKQDLEFRNYLFDLISKYDNIDSPITLKYYLERLVESMSFFQEYTKEWKIQTK